MFVRLTTHGPLHTNPMAVSDHGWMMVKSEPASAGAGVRNLFVGANEVTDIKIGSTDVNEVYVGSTLMWSRS